MILTVEQQKSDPGEIAICFDDDGLEFLLKKLSFLKNNDGHLHLMTCSWGGNELTEIRQGSDDYALVDSLRLVKLR
ncbi:hypothetical protein GOZ78_17725 [Agrobacterium vitis]|uniref:Uncharacterized protein n=1 Tax=Agrobacterium vitis TaxID=373 RepID=A0ABD6GHL7_AGRVI|nr:Imm32 family immunity protein [Agrobacterium vitis]MUO79433.1 hypothetical protein [Agrobacterium vitis]MUO96258.1 hypothetical protein [Agrobacterium vitis]MUP05677.1 hypothetical protein [Agrobacterium vitis]MUZ82761.1 hypothetical protein [Agrobacterium vitis]MVA11863.1 hypothetical protein [Agrobacterium vitis]